MPRAAAFRLVLYLISIFSCFLGSEARGTEAGHNSSADERIILTVGRSVVLDRTEDIRRVAITDDQVADAIVVSPRELLINGRSAGITSLVLGSRSGNREFFTISVSPNIEQLVEHIRQTFPEEPVRVRATRGVITLSGKASSKEVLEKIKAIVGARDP